MPSSLPLFLAGPILRRTTKNEICLWAITSEPLLADFTVFHPDDDEPFFSQPFKDAHQLELGNQCYAVLAEFKAEGAVPVDVPCSYDILSGDKSLIEDLEQFLYPGEKRPTFTISSKATNIAHGSCRHPHHHCEDALAALDRKYAELDVSQRADMLIMSGDQIYADDVCGPLMYAIRQSIALLGLHDQAFDGEVINHCSDLATHNTPLYSRASILPKTQVNHGFIKRFFKAAPEPVFSSRTVDNHLISFNEFVVMYMLVWSPALWQVLALPSALELDLTDAKLRTRWDAESEGLKRFCATLPHVRRLMAHIPTYMIFDDHDITDDFNLTVGWEKGISSSTLAQAVINNGMLGYFLCQGWGNDPAAFDDKFMDIVGRFVSHPDLENFSHVSQLLQHFEQWHYTVPTTPKVVVIDTRTRRWRSESSDNKPSGLMDWESLMDFQQDVFNNEGVVVVSPAPMFGVKFIETLQRIVTFFGHPLATDSENWMAHPGSANALLNIFKHPKTPKNFVILSGDVHYSFAYDIRLRFRKGSPRIWQITCSGFRNQFPEPFLSVFEWFDRKLFWPESPLNVFTRRKRMRIERRRPDNGSKQYLVNASAVGEVRLNLDGSPAAIGLLTGHGEQVTFLPIENTPHTQEETSLGSLPQD
ncbi:alkaline phosphatase family protein [Enterovibrio sp. ZSDZ35]|uniref:Alkaline phosphatase family protein n=1 Tax=Enterovibrio qingdaonensis TaxID=2899818 RepID=A0ABT5QGY0_9GAMM|nr:alkaline phosphatase D family protein [Enterovibrio sp. ZSDZ35]MDD1780242.1 alkaline phosphatase family protein [Enterovibrio sp. ZSDZ35]